MRKTLGTVGLLGCVAAVLADGVAVVVVEGYDPISQTISALAAGPHSWIEDSGLIALSVAILAIAAGLACWPSAAKRWFAGCLATTSMGLLLLTVALYNGYGNAPEKSAIHMTLVWLMSGFFFASALLLAQTPTADARGWRLYSLGLASLWLLGSIPFFFLPTSMDGIYERCLALLVIAWLAGAAWLLLGSSVNDSDFSWPRAS